MDPDATLNEIRELFDSYAEDDIDISAVANKFDALDAWLSSGGFLPRSWDLSVTRTVPSTRPHETIWCDRCAKGEHNFVKADNGKIYCLCCSVKRA